MFNKLKEWLKNFDIKPQPPVVGALLAQAQEVAFNGQITKAIGQLKDILRLSPFNKNALELLSRLYCEYNYTYEGLKLLRFCVRTYPQEGFFWRYRGTLLSRIGKRQQAIDCFTKALKLNPQDVNAQHLLQAAKNDCTLNTNPLYVKNLFNSYALEFESSLAKLNYSGPLILINYLLKNCGNNFANIIDLGCGTGLMGQQIAKNLIYKQLIGVDIANKMLIQAKDKNIYTQLSNMEIISYLEQNIKHNIKYDLIISIDVFMYIGELSALFHNVSQALKEYGCFAFSVEDYPHQEGFFLHSNGRFAHSQAYIAQTLHKNNLKIIGHQQEIMRHELGKPVYFCMYLACLT